MDDSKERVFPRLNRIDAHMNSESLWPHMQDLHKSNLCKIPALKWGSRHRVLSLIKNQFTIDVSCQTGNQVDQMECHLVILTSRQAGPMLKSSWANAKKDSGIWGLLGEGFVLFWHFFEYCVLFVLILCFLISEREGKILMLNEKECEKYMRGDREEWDKIKIYYIIFN